MTNTLARIKREGKNFEIIVNLDDALKFKKGELSSVEVEGDRVFTDSKKGFVASESDLNKSFGTTDVNEIASRIIKNGEILITQEKRDEEREKKFKQVVDFLSRNAIEPRSGNPHSPDRIKKALEEAHVNLKNVPIENQISEIVEQISKILPIRIAKKKVKVTIPAIHTGKAYGVINQFKENENWLGNGDLEAVVSVPSGIIMDFYDKLNSMTHGSVLTEEIKDA